MAFDEKAKQLHRIISICARECREDGRIAEAETYEATLETMQDIWG